MKSGMRFLVLAAVCAFAVTCGSGSAPSPDAASSLPIDQLRDHHPRLLLTGARLAALKPELNSSHRWLWQRFEREIPAMVAAARSTEPPEDVRSLGDLATELACAAVLTGEDSLYDIARDHLLRLTDPATWDAPGSLVYLIGSHFLMGISLSYDWFYPRLTPDERAQVVQCLGREAQKQYESIVSGRIWWRNQYYQNHSHSNFCGLAYSAAALWGEDPRAADWMAVCEKFFDKVFEVMPADGSSVEGYAYSGYGAEYLFKYSAMASEMLGRDYSGSPWMKNYATYLIQGLLPYRTPRVWAMTFGDGPQRGWSNTAHHLMYLAGVYRDSRAQWMARTNIEAGDSSLGSQGWMTLTFYDPSVPVADPAELPTEAYFPEVGQVMLRSAWDDTSAGMVGIMCGPFMTKSRSQDVPFDWGTGHAEPDAGSFQLFSHGRFLAVGALYTGYKRTGNHNTMLFKGKGQLGEHMPGFASIECLKFGQYPEIVFTDFGPKADYVVGDVRRAYHPALGLTKYLRHWLYLKPDILLVSDEVELSGQGMVYDFPSRDLETGGDAEHNGSGQVTGKNGKAYTEFDGTEGSYRIYACYLDNQPEAFDFSIAVDGQVIHGWKSHNQDIDDNLIQVTLPVSLRKGSRIEFRGGGNAEGWRLTKIAAFSDEVPAERSAQWLMHFEPETEVKQADGRLTVISAGAALDHYALLPEGSKVNVEEYLTEGADTEPFNYKTTRRLVVRPEFDGDKLTMLTLIRMRPAAEQPLAGVSASLRDGRIEVSWKKDGVRQAVDWSLTDRAYTIK